MASLSISTAGQTCIPKSRIIQQVPVPWCFFCNNFVSLKQAHPLSGCRADKKFLEDTAIDAHKLRNVKVYVASHNSIEQIQPGLGLNYNSEKLQKVFSYLFRTELGGLVKVLVGANNMKHVVNIEVSSLPLYLNDHNLMLSWDMFRSDSSHLYAPDSQTSMLDTTEATSDIGRASIRTPFTQNSLGTHATTLEFDSTQAPFYLSFSLLSASSHVATDSVIKTHRKTNFCVPVGINSGWPMPLGFSKSEDGTVNFALFSRKAESIILCLYESGGNQPSLEIELDPYINRTGDIWHVSMESVGNYVSYGYRCKGEITWDKGNSFHARRVLLDPYAQLIKNFIPDQGESVYLGYLGDEPAFDWSGDVQPHLSMEKLVVYRLNVRSFTKDKSSGLPENVAGTFAGVIEKLQHFKSLGVNAVLLEPIFSFDEKRGPYFPYHFFSPMNSYGCTHDGMSTERSMKEMVKALHAHDIEVLLEVVFTHTGEGGTACETISFRGIDNSSYYITEGGIGSGINNAMNCNNPNVQHLILDSLRYWLTEYHVDGFCFINSSYLLRGSNGDRLACPPLVEAIAFDPLLSKTKLIADCWCPVDMSHADIHFPHWKRWAEINARFCRDVRNFLRGEGLLSDLATRLCGSGDIFSDSRGPTFSFNYVTKNFGLPLVDLVSFSSNELASELSWNCGEEGATNKKLVLEVRLKQIRNFLLILFISLGVPVFNMGDECGFSTGGLLFYGDRRPINWNGLKTVFGKQITQFIAFLSSLRIRRSDLFQRRDFLKEKNIEWHGSNQSEPKWGDPSSKFLAMTLRAEKTGKLSSSDKGDMFICFNASDLPENVILPQLPEGYAWVCLVDTALPYPGFFSMASNFSDGLSAYALKPHSCTLFESGKSDN